MTLLLPAPDVQLLIVGRTGGGGSLSDKVHERKTITDMKISLSRITKISSPDLFLQ